MNNAPREEINNLIKHFWQNGYLTVSRKYGTYLPEPEKIGEYEVDAIGRYDNKYVLGLVISSSELDNPELSMKLSFLATRNTRYTHKKVMLYLGTETKNLLKLKMILASLDESIRKNIRIVVTDPEPYEITQTAIGLKQSKRFA
jgi:hypothetical protein